MVEPPPEKEEDFESPSMTKPPMPKFTSKFEAGKYTSGVEAFLSEDGSALKYTNTRKELFSNKCKRNIFPFLEVSNFHHMIQFLLSLLRNNNMYFWPQKVVLAFE